MKESIHSYMRLGTVFSMSFPKTVSDNQELLARLRQIARDADFEAVELTHMEDPNTRREAAKICREAGLAVSYAAQSCLLGAGKNLNSLIDRERTEAVALLKRCVDEAYEIGACSLSFLAGSWPQGEESRTMEVLTDSVLELCDYARKKGNLRLAIEVFDYDLDKCSFIGPAGRVRELLERVCAETDNFGVLTDLSHIPQIHETVKESILPVKEYITQVHVGNCVIKKGSPLYGDQHPRYGFLDSAVGLPMVVEYLETLLDIGFLSKSNRPIVSFEVKPYGEDEDTVLASSKRMLRRAWSLAGEGGNGKWNN